MPALALTDRDGLYGAFKHVRACADAGIKPLLGADLALLTSDPRAPIAGTGRVTLLAVGRQGWASLCRLVSRRPRRVGAGRPASRGAETAAQAADARAARPTTTSRRSPPS